MFCCRLFFCTLLIVVVASPALAEDQEELKILLERPILDPQLPLQEVQEFCKSHVLTMPHVETVEQWEQHAEQIRQAVLDRVVFRGEATKWRTAPTEVQWQETLEGGVGYHVRKLRYEALPGLWIPALLYVPDKLEGKVPVVMNTNGHEPLGKAVHYKQIRCINQAKRGMIALSPDWFGMGQLKTPDFVHYRMNQLDLCGTSGLAPFYLSMKRGLDLLLALEHADPERVAVTGVSGGGWQTIFISSLDPRVTLANPVAGYSSFVTRAQHLKGLGDSEQTPVDLAAIADYTHLTAMRAPRPTLLTHNAMDNCCFVAGDALPPLLKAAEPIFQLYGKRANLRTHINYIPGTHNYALDNRLELYRMFGEHFFAGQADYPLEEFPCENELKTPEQLHVELPDDNANFHTLAISLAKNLPSNPQLPTSKEEALAWQTQQRKLLAEVVKASHEKVQAKQAGEQAFEGGTATFWKLKVGDAWTVPAVELVRGEPTSTVILVADGGRKSTAASAKELLDSGHRVLAVDPFYFGESTISARDFLFAILVSSVGQRPLGVDASQLAAIARWSAKHYDTGPVAIHATGPRSSLYALVAAALETKSIGDLELQEAYGSLKEIIDQNMSVQQAPDLFCFGLLKHFDMKQLAALAAPRRVALVAPSQRARTELADLKLFYAVLGVDFEPLQ